VEKDELIIISKIDHPSVGFESDYSDIVFIFLLEVIHLLKSSVNFNRLITRSEELRMISFDVNVFLNLFL